MEYVYFETDIQNIMVLTLFNLITPELLDIYKSKANKKKLHGTLSLLNKPRCSHFRCKLLFYSRKVQKTTVLRTTFSENFNFMKCILQLRNDI